MDLIELLEMGLNFGFSFALATKNSPWRIAFGCGGTITFILPYEGAVVLPRRCAP